MKKINLTKIPGIIGRSVEYDNTLLEVVGSPEAIVELKQRLQTVNTSAMVQYKRCTKRAAFWGGRLASLRLSHKHVTDPLTKENLAKQIRDAEARRDENVDQAKEFKEKINWEFYDHSDDGVFIPAGFWSLCEQIRGDTHLNAEVEPKLIDMYRPYQKELHLEMMKYKRSTGVMATGLGKTLVIAGIAKSFAVRGMRTIILEPSDYLVGQTLRTIKRFHESATGASSKRQTKIGADILVCTAQSAKKYIQNFDCVVIDECIPYNQAVLTEEGPVEIGKLYHRWIKNKKLPLVKSFNEKTNKFELKNITNFWKRQNRDELVVIKSSRLKLKTTPDHPVMLLGKKYLKASDIQKGHILLGTKNVSEKAGLGGVVWNDDQIQIIMGSLFGDGSFGLISSQKYRLSVVHGDKQKDYLLWKKEMLHGSYKYIEKNGYSQKPAHRTTTKMFHVSSKRKITKKSPPLGYLLNINIKGFAVLFMDDASVDHRGKQISFHTYDCGEKVNSLLADRLKRIGYKATHRKFKYKKKNKEYWGITIGVESYYKFLKDIAPYVHKNLSYKIPTCFSNIVGTYNWDNTEYDHMSYLVEKTEIIKYKKTPGEGYGVFDIEVADNHNFVICGGNSRHSGNHDGVVTHNCHHSPAATWLNLLSKLEKANFVYNLTATPFREDGMDIAIHAYAGPIVYERNLKWGIENGWLEHFDVYMVFINVKKRGGDTVQVSEKSATTTAYKKLIGHSYFQKIVAKKLNEALSKARKAMTLFRYLPQARDFSKRIDDIQVADADYKKPLDDFCKGITDALIATDKLVSEGIDIPEADVLFHLVQNSSDITSTQALGRILRKGGKKPILFDFVATNYKGFRKSANKRLKLWQQLADKVHVIEI